MATCFYCGKRLSLLTRLGGDGRFCSAAHSELYYQEMERLAMRALNLDPPQGTRPGVGSLATTRPDLPFADVIQLELVFQAVSDGSLQDSRWSHITPLVSDLTAIVPTALVKPSQASLTMAGPLPFSQIRRKRWTTLMGGDTSPVLRSPVIPVEHAHFREVLIPSAANSIPVAPETIRAKELPALFGRKRPVRREFLPLPNYQEMERLAMRALNLDPWQRTRPGVGSLVQTRPDLPLADVIQLEFVLHAVSDESLRDSCRSHITPWVSDLTAIVPTALVKSSQASLTMAGPLQFSQIRCQRWTALMGGATSPVQCSIQPVIPVEHAHFREVLIPTAANSIPVAPEMIRANEFPALFGRKRPVRREFLPLPIQPIGVDDPDDSALQWTTVAPANATPAIVGERIIMNPSLGHGAIQPAAPRILPLRKDTATEPAMFIPRVRTGTFRPRMSFGPLPNMSFKSMSEVRRTGNRYGDGVRTFAGAAG